MPTIFESVKDKLGTVLITTVIALATAFSDHIVGAIKQEVNKADQRPAQQERIAKDVSDFVFYGEGEVEFLSQNMTTKTELHFVGDPYNTSIVSLRRGEYVYRAAVARYWPDSSVQKFDAFYEQVRLFDATIHAFNPQFGEIESGTKSKGDPAKIAPLAAAASAALPGLERSARELMTALSK